MAIRGHSTIHFKSCTVQDLLDQASDGSEFPSCLSNEDLQNPLGVVFVLTPQLAISILDCFDKVQLTSALEAFYYQVELQLQRINWKPPTDSFFRVVTPEQIVGEIDNLNGNFTKFLKPDCIVQPLEIVVVLTVEFARSIAIIISKTQPMGLLKDFRDHINNLINGG